MCFERKEEKRDNNIDKRKERLDKTNSISFSSIPFFISLVPFFFGYRPTRMRGQGKKKACSRHDECSLETAADLRTVIPQRRFNDRPEAARCHGWGLRLVAARF